MSSPSAAKIAANIANAQRSTGPRTEAGRATSAKNATKAGLFANTDCIRPGEEESYQILDQGLHHDLVPAGHLEYHYVEEIRRAMWRLRRCGQVEADMGITCAEAAAQTEDAGSIPDPMQFEPTAKLQASVDRARAQCHRLLNRCNAELRKLQTERLVRNETTEAGEDIGHLGLSEVRSVRKALDEQALSQLIQHKLDARVAEIVSNRRHNAAVAIPVEMLSAFNPVQTPLANQTHQPTETAPAPTPAPPPAAKQTHPGRNSRCACGSGQKYKRCCARKAVPLPQAA